MKVIDLFSGIGGFSLGLESTGGFETVQFVEYDKWCQKVLAKNFPNVPITGDIKDYEGQRADVVTGGFPCQPFSVAGKRKGTDDDRHLWPEMLRVIKASKPRFVIGENVRNITSIQDGMVFEQVCTDLENEGYEVQSFIIPASAVEAPHQRYRVWIVAASGISPTYEKRAGKGKVRKYPIPNLAAEVMEGIPYQVQVEMRNNPQMWNTPNSMDALPPRSEVALKKQYDKNRKGRTEHSTLREQVVYPKPQQMWPRPRSAIGMHMKLTQNMANLRHKRYLETEVAYQEKAPNNHLNSDWVEWLMGYPKGWTDMKDSTENQTSQESPQDKKTE